MTADHLLAALKFFRTCLGLQDEFYYSQLIQNHTFAQVLDIVYETLPRDNLLNSACLEIFEFIKRENIKPIVTHIVETYRPRLQDITYVDLFEQLILRYDQMQGYNAEMGGTIFGQEEEGATTRTKVNGSRRWQGVKEMDAEEEQYFNTSDDEDELSSKSQNITSLTNGASPLLKHLMDYSDDEDEVGDGLLQSFYHKPLEAASDPLAQSSRDISNGLEASRAAAPPQTPPERLSEKRRREDDEEDELGKLSLTKRRSSSASSVGSATSGNILRRKKSFSNPRSTTPGKKIAISLAVKSPAVGAEQGGGDGA